MWDYDMIVDNRRKTNADIILGHANLPGNVGVSLNFDVNMSKSLAEWIDFDQARVHRLPEPTESGDKTNTALLNVLIRIRKDKTARHSSYASDDVP